MIWLWLWSTRKSTGTATHESTIIAPLQHRRYMQGQGALALRRPMDRPAPAACRSPAGCRCPVLWRAPAGRPQSWPGLGPSARGRNGSSPTQKIHEASTLHPPAGRAPSPDVHAMIRTTYSKACGVFPARRFAWAPQGHGVKHTGRGWASSPSFRGFHLIAS